MESKISQENEDDLIYLHKNLEKVSQLQLDVDALTEENSELFVLLQNERRKSKELQSELEFGNLNENSLQQSTTGDTEFAHVQETSDDFLQKVVVILRERLESKESECEELKDKLSVMNQELATQGEELARATLEFEDQLKHLHELLAQERHLNSLLSEESDQTVHELETQIQEKDDINTELKVVQGETYEKMFSVEEECRFYQTKLNDTENRLRVVTSEHEQLARETESVSCQVSESELHALKESENETHRRNTFNKIFTSLWDKGVIEMNGMGNATRYKMSIFNLIQNGFRNLRQSVVV